MYVIHNSNSYATENTLRVNDKDHRLILYTKIIAIYYKNCKKHKIKSFWKLYQLEPIVSYKWTLNSYWELLVH
jgi:hypothetical protein